MPTPATLDQGKKLLELISEYPQGRIRDLLDNSYLFKALLNCPDLSKVDKKAFSAFLAATQPKPQLSILLTPVSEYVDRIMARSELRGWGFTQTDAKELAAKLHDHYGPLTPTGVSIWLGNNLEFNWTEMIAWIKDEVEDVGFTFEERFSPDYQLSFYPGSEQSGNRKLGVVDLDLSTFWDPTDGVVSKYVRLKRPESKWPGLEVPLFLALNPQVYVAMDGKTIPYMLAAGLVVYDDSLPGFNRHDRMVYVGGDWDSNHWRNTSVVAFRE